MSARVKQKEDLLAWVNDQWQLDTVTKFILHRLALLANADHCAWAKVETLAQAVNKVERTIRYHLRSLEEAGLIEKTDRTHRLTNSTRSVPIYQIAPKVSGFDIRVSMPAKIAGILPEDAGYACKIEGGMPAIGLQVHKELNGTEEEAIASSASEWDREAIQALMGRIRAAYPRRGLGWSDPAAALDALTGLIEAGVDVEQLPGCAERMAQDPAIKRRDFGPPKMETWLSKRQFEGWLPDDPAVEASHVVALAGPDAIPAEIVEGLGGAFMANWAPGATWSGEDRTIVTQLKIQAEKIRAVRADDLAKHGLRVTWRAAFEAEQHQGAVS